METGGEFDQIGRLRWIVGSYHGFAIRHRSEKVSKLHNNNWGSVSPFAGLSCGAFFRDFAPWPSLTDYKSVVRVDQIGWLPQIVQSYHGFVIRSCYPESTPDKST